MRDKPLAMTMRRIAEAWDNAVTLTLERDMADYDPSSDVPDATTCRQFYFLGALAALTCLVNGARPAALQDEAESVLDMRHG
jgi:hypothetical protein